MFNDARSKRFSIPSPQIISNQNDQLVHRHSQQLSLPKLCNLFSYLVFKLGKKVICKMRQKEGLGWLSCCHQLFGRLVSVENRAIFTGEMRACKLPYG